MLPIPLLIRTIEHQPPYLPPPRNVPIVRVVKQLIKPFPREGAASWVSDRYVGPGLDRMEVHSTEIEGKDDVYLQRYAHWSKDNGRTWSLPEKIADTERHAAGKSVWEGGGTEVYDPESRALVRLWLRQIQQNGQYHNFTYWQISRDKGRIWSTPVQLCYEPKVDFDEKDPHDPRFLAVNQGYFGNRILRRRDGSLVAVLAHANAPGDPENGRRAWRMGSVLFTGRWNARSSAYDWTPGARVETTPEQSGRGLMEPDVADLSDGRLLVVWRQDSTAQVPGCKLFSISRDGGKSLTSPQPWRYDDGSSFFSPSSIHYFLRHSRTRKLYWIGNICPDPPRRNSPRYPLIIAEVDEQRAALKRSTVTIIDDRRPEQAETLQLSNFSVLENRETGEIELKLAVIGSYPGRSVYTGDAYCYRLSLVATEPGSESQRGLPQAASDAKGAHAETLGVTSVPSSPSGPLRPLGLFPARSQKPTGAPRTWQAGLARSVITPDEPVWMSGYAGRREPTGKLHDLCVKALALQDARGRRAVLVTSDPIGFSGEAYRRMLRQIGARWKLRPDQVILSFSHTHTGPVLSGSLIDYFPLDAAAAERVERYSARLESMVVDTIGRALADLHPAILETTFDSAPFAVNRRENREADVPAMRARGEPLKGPVDHSVPVLLVRDSEGGRLRGMVFGYACHATTLASTEWSGDYPGFAQMKLEADRPGLQAMYWAGCGADQNPLPRRTVELCREYGNQLAEAVARAISRPSQPVEPSLGTASETIPLAFESVVESGVLRLDAGQDSMRGRWATRMLKRRESADPMATAADYPYPIVVWRLGRAQWLTALAGEVVVDYSLRLKRELGEGTWTMAYVNDMVAYIPSERVLKEGGYEGNGVYEYGLPAERWKAGLEEQIVGTVKRLATKAQR